MSCNQYVPMPDRRVLHCGTYWSLSQVHILILSHPPHLHADRAKAVLGISAAYTVGFLTGAGALGFLIGSCVGFCAGSIHYFYIAKKEAFFFLRKYPRIMKHHLILNFPANGYEAIDIVGMVRRERDFKDASLEREFGSWARKAHCSSAYQTAMPTLRVRDAVRRRSTFDCGCLKDY